MKSLIAWFANNGVVANLLMLIIVLLGVMGIFTVNQEVFPEFEAQMISVSVPYRGAAPEEVEEAVSVRLEESIQGLEGVKRITSTSSEGSASVMVEVETGYDTRVVLDDVKARVDASWADGRASGVGEFISTASGLLFRMAKSKS